MHTTEFRIILPLTVEEYQVAQLYTVNEMSRQETHGDAGVEIIANEPCEDPVLGKGQYTHKIYHLGSRMPKFITFMAPASALILEEKAWNCYPNCKTVLTNQFLGDRFSITVDTKHEANRATNENALNIPQADLARRHVVNIDIADSVSIEPKDYDVTTDPNKFKSEKTGRGPLVGDWQKTCEPSMTCYKLITTKFKVFGLESRAESFIAKYQFNLFFKFHRMLFCLMDKWFGLTMDDIRRLEEEAKQELKNKIEAQKQHTLERKQSVKK